MKAKIYKTLRSLCNEPLIRGGAVVLLIASFVLFTSSKVRAGDGDARPYGSSPSGVYTELEEDDGVFNDGQAALWDLNMLDHFHYFGPPARAKGYQPEQPIDFSHVTHVQQNKLECQYCHWSVDKSPYANIPEVQTCMGCHNIVKGTTDQQKEEIAKITEYYTKGEPIPWEKVHVMPDYVKFNHKRHVKAGVSCQECHGQIPNMTTVKRVSSMKMGWCVECHRMRGASIDCTTCHF